MKLNIEIGELFAAIEEFKNIKLTSNQEVAVDDLNIRVNTPTGLTTINHIIRKDDLPIKTLTFSDGHTLGCADKHILVNHEGLDTFVDQLRVGSTITTKHGQMAIASIEDSGVQNCYDISIDAPHHYYDAHGLLHHNTLMTATLSILTEKYGRSIIIVPSKSLVVQTEEDYVNLGLDVGVFFGERKELGRTHTICTWQSVSALFKNSKDAAEDEYTIWDMVDGVAAVIVDEVHSAKGAILKELLVGPMANVPIRIGLTGTIPKEEDAQMTLLSCLGPIVGEIKASDLQDQGVLAQCHVHAIQTDDSHIEYNDYASESAYLTTDYTRIEWIAKLTQAIANDGNTLILVNKIETGELLQGMIANSVFVNGATKNKDRVDQYKEVQTATNKVLIATYGVAAVGLNVPRLFHVIMVEPGKSFVRVIQTIGRGIRKANDKDAVDIWDLTSNMKFSAKHLTKRKEFYKDAEYSSTTRKVAYRVGTTDFAALITDCKKAASKKSKKKNDDKR